MFLSPSLSPPLPGLLAFVVVVVVVAVVVVGVTVAGGTVVVVVVVVVISTLLCLLHRFVLGLSLSPSLSLPLSLSHEVNQLLVAVRPRGVL